MTVADGPIGCHTCQTVNALTLVGFAVDPATRGGVSRLLCGFSHGKSFAGRFVNHAIGHVFTGAVDVECATVFTRLHDRRCYVLGSTPVLIGSHGDSLSKKQSMNSL